MEHCVFTHAALCARGGAHNFSLRLVHGDDVRTLLTIEVRKRAIVQARGRRNADPSRQARDVMRRWAAAAGLHVRLGV